MVITVINGSPKGDNSITLQTVLYLKKKHPEHEFRILNAGSRINQYEKDFSEAAKALSEAQLILFSYPVYTFIAPSQLHRFIAKMKRCGIDLRGKFMTQITTSKHFYDVTAHRYVLDNAQDMGMKCVKGLSADMDDLLHEKGQKEAEKFFDHALWCVENDLHEPARIEAVHAPAHIPTDLCAATEKHAGDVVIVADLAKEDAALARMIERFRATLPIETRLVNIHEFPFKGGCLSCFHCATDGKCVYKDGFDAFLREQIQTADAIVLAYTVQDHSMGTVFKTYDDRQFCNGHRTVTMGKPFAYLVSGNLNGEENLRTIMDARAEVGGNYLAGVACDETDPNGEIDALAKELDYAVTHRYLQPQNFYGVGGMKIFRDLIWQMQGLMKADHKFYKKHGQYDFPQKHFGTMLSMYLVGALLSNKKLMAKMGGKMNEGMLGPYKKVIDKA